LCEHAARRLFAAPPEFDLIQTVIFPTSTARVSAPSRGLCWWWRIIF
jgi:hypothetical protein